MEQNAGDSQPSIGRHNDDMEWRTLLEAAGRRTHAQGLTEDDVPRLVAEARRDRREPA